MLLAAELAVARERCAGTAPRAGRSAASPRSRRAAARGRARSAASWSGCVEQREHAARHEVPRGVAARVDEQQEEEVELEVAEAFALDLGLEQHARDVVGRPRALRGPHAGRVAHHLEHRGLRVGGLRRSGACARSARRAGGRPRAGCPSARRSRRRAARPRRRPRSRTRRAPPPHRRSPAESSRMRFSSRATRRGVKPLFTRPRSRVCSGGSMPSSIRRLCTTARVHVLRSCSPRARRRTWPSRATRRARRRAW